MKQRISLLRNTIYIIGTEQLSRAINFIQVAILIRYLGKNEYGIWSLTQSIPSMFYVLTDMGLNSIMLRNIARDKVNQEQYLTQVIYLKLILFIIFIGVIVFFSKISGYESNVNYLIVITSVAYLLTSFTDVITAVFRAHENFAFEAIIHTIKSVVFLLLAYAVILLDLKINGFVYALLVLNALISLVCLYWYTIKFKLIKLKIFEYKIYTDLIKTSLPFALLSFISPIFSQIDIVMLSRLSTFESVGIYNAAYRIFVFLFVIPIALKNVLFPRLSKLYSQSFEQYQTTFNSACRMIALLALPMSTGLFLLADKIIILLYSRDYIDSTIPLKIMAITLFFANLRTIFGVTLYSSNRERQAIFMFGIATVLNGIFDYFLIPKMNYTGAALASLFAELFLILMYYLYIKKSLSIIFDFTVILKICFSSLIMGIAVIMTMPLPLIFQVIIGIVVYALLIYLVRALSKEEFLNIIRSIKTKREPSGV